MRNKRTMIDDTMRNRILSMAKQQSRRKAGISALEITNKMNSKYGTNLSVFQVSACFGNAGYKTS